MKGSLTGAARTLRNKILGASSSSWQPSLIPEGSNIAKSIKEEESKRYFLSNGSKLQLESTLEEEMREVEDDKAKTEVGRRYEKRQRTPVPREVSPTEERDRKNSWASVAAATRRQQSFSRPPSSASTTSSSNPNWILKASTSWEGEDDGSNNDRETPMPHQWRNRRAFPMQPAVAVRRAPSSSASSAVGRRFFGDSQFSIYRPGASRFEDVGGF